MYWKMDFLSYVLAGDANFQPGTLLPEEARREHSLAVGVAVSVEDVVSVVRRPAQPIDVIIAQITRAVRNVRMVYIPYQISLFPHCRGR